MSDFSDLIIKSNCGKYQYVEIIPLEGGDKGACAVIGICPQERVEGKTDKGIENCIAYAYRNGYLTCHREKLLALQVHPGPQTASTAHYKYPRKAPHVEIAITGPPLVAMEFRMWELDKIHLRLPSR